MSPSQSAATCTYVLRRIIAPQTRRSSLTRIFEDPHVVAHNHLHVLEGLLQSYSGTHNLATHGTIINSIRSMQVISIAQYRICMICRIAFCVAAKFTLGQ
jgi:hypothetical protein